ncbi:hypothetical protein Tco_0814209 [Tanacetum coccineum]
MPPSSGVPPPLLSYQFYFITTLHTDPILVERASSATAARPLEGLRADYRLCSYYGLGGAPVSTDTELGRHMTAFETRVRQDTDEIYTRLSRRLGGRSMDASEFTTQRGYVTTHYRTRDERSCGQRMYPTTAAYTDIDSDAVITGTGDHTTGTGDNTTGTGYHTTGTTGTRWRSCTARAARGGW